MSTANASSDRCVQFKETLKQWKVKAVCGREYVQVDKLVKWMNEGEPRNVDLLLDSCDAKKGHFSIDKATTNSIAGGENQCLLVFSILLELDQGKLISDLRRHEFFDSKLPLDLARVEKTLKKRGILKKHPTLAQRFNEAQWKYCPLKFELGEDREPLAEQIIPVCEKQTLKEGGTAWVHQILVQEECVHQTLRQVVPNSRYEDPVYGPCFVFALKTYKEGNETLYENEKVAFHGLKGHKGMIKCLFSYSQVQDEASGIGTSNLVLEFGECDLTDWFCSHLPPVLEMEQLEFWSDLFLVADAVRDIHDFKHPGVNGAERYYGWHADIKPDNILNVQGEFKMADPGFARFERQSEATASNNTTTYLGGTVTFGAPECYVGEHRSSSQRSLATVTRAIDIWSLGCVFSIVATWMVYGPPGLDQFEELRKEVILEKLRASPSNDEQGFKLAEGDYFHDGHDVLPAVRQWHAYLRRGMRKSDRITEKVLKLTEDHMLVGKDTSRISAKALCTELQNIISRATELPVPPVDDPVQRALHRTEQMWKAKAEAARMEQDEKGAEATVTSTMSHTMANLRRSQLGPRRASSHFLTTTIQTSHRSKAVGKASGLSAKPSRVFIPQGSQQSQPRVLVHAPLPKLEEEQSPLTPDTEPQLPLVSPLELTPSPPQFSSTENAGLVHASTGLSTATHPSHRRRSSWRSSTLNSLVSTISLKPKKPKGDEELSRIFADRDLIFIVDNGASMAHHWDNVKGLLIDLVGKALHVDKNGMELKFTTTGTKFKASNKLKRFEEEINKEEHKPGKLAETNMTNILYHLLRDYLKLYQVHKDKARKQTLIVLTDGKWNAMHNKLGVDNTIIDFNKRLKEMTPFSLENEERRVSIQFVQFGNDLFAKKRLYRLDTKLKYKGVPDIVDHKPAKDTELTKILTGSIDESDDEEENDVEAELVSSPDTLDGKSKSTPGQQASNGSPSSKRVPGLTREPSKLELAADVQPAGVEHQPGERRPYPRNPLVLGQANQHLTNQQQPSAPAVHISHHE